jgi:hypothetical protein
VTCRRDRNSAVNLQWKVGWRGTFLLADSNISTCHVSKSASSNKSVRQCGDHFSGTIESVIRALTTILLLFLLSACRGANDKSAPASAPGPGTSAAAGAPAVPVSGTERIGWTQAATDVSHYRFVLYVDGGAEATDLPDARCTPSGPGTFDCQARLPKLTPGTHQVQVGAMTTAGNQVVEGSKSAPFTVVVTGSAPAGRQR